MYYYKFDITKWLKRTARLLPEAEGIYLRLINHYYDTEKPLPLDLTRLARQLGLSAYRDQMQEIIDDFFVETGDGYKNDKCDAILAEYHKNADKNRLNGAKGGRPPSRNNPELTESDPTVNPVGSQSVPSGGAKANPDHNPNERQFTEFTELTELTGKDISSAGADSSVAKATTRPVPFEKIKKKWDEMAARVGLPQCAKLTTKLKGQIRQRHLDLNRSSSQWDNLFQTVADNDFLAGRAPAGPNRSSPFRCTLEWATNETNFVKIAEGVYD